MVMILSVSHLNFIQCKFLRAVLKMERAVSVVEGSLWKIRKGMEVIKGTNI